MPIVESFEVETSEGRRYKVLRYSPLDQDIESLQLITECGLITKEITKGIYGITLKDGVTRLARRLEGPPRPFTAKKE